MRRVDGPIITGKDAVETRTDKRKFRGLLTVTQEFKHEHTGEHVFRLLCGGNRIEVTREQLVAGDYAPRLRSPPTGGKLYRTSRFTAAVRLV